VRAVPRLCEFYPGICLTTEEKARKTLSKVNPLNAKFNPICHLLALLGAHHILHISRIRVKKNLSQSRLEETWHEDERKQTLQVLQNLWQLTEIKDIIRQNADNKDLFNSLPFLRETVAAVATVQ